MTWHWHDLDWGVFVSIEASGAAAYGLRDDCHGYVESLTQFDPADGLPLQAREAIIAHDGDPSLAFVVPCGMRQ